MHYRFSLTLVALYFCLSLPLTHAAAQSAPKPSKRVTDSVAEAKMARMAWWRDARFGMFIHWGVYSVPAGRYEGKEIPGLGEWIMHDAKIPRATYQQFARSFNPVKYDPDAWVRLAKEAGVKYIVITSKHHDGFALFDSQASDWNVVKATPYGKDLLKPLAEACRKYGMKLGFYYSQANDWNNPGGAAAGGHWDSTQNGNMDDYIRRVAVPQVKEILTNYGDVAELWWDVPTGMTPERAAQFLPLLKLQPNIVVNNRLGGGVKGDIETPEQYIPATGIPGRDWETCMTINDTWGFKTDDTNWKSSESLIRNLIDIASKGGNYLLNIGPTSEGTIPPAIVERLQAIGRWMKVNGEAIYGTQASPFAHLDWGRCTVNWFSPGHPTFYLHVFNWPKDSTLIIPGLMTPPHSAYLLDGGAKVACELIPKVGLKLHLPSRAPDSVASVIVLKDIYPLLITNTPKAASPSSNGVVTLLAKDAFLFSKGDFPQVEGDPEHENIGYWTDTSAGASWHFLVAKPGNYDLYAEVATPADSSMLRVRISRFDMKDKNFHALTTLEQKVNHTGSYGTYTEQWLGRVKLPVAVPYNFEISPVGGLWKPINLRNVQLRPAE